MKKEVQKHPNVFFHEADRRIKSQLFFSMEDSYNAKPMQTSQQPFVKVSTTNANFISKWINITLSKQQTCTTCNNQTGKALKIFFWDCRAKQPDVVEQWITKRGNCTQCFIAKERFKEVQRGLCIRPGNSPVQIRKSALFQGKS